MGAGALQSCNFGSPRHPFRRQCSRRQRSKASDLHRYKRPPTRQEEGQEALHTRYEPGTFFMLVFLEDVSFRASGGRSHSCRPARKKFPLLAAGELILRPTFRHTSAHEPPQKAGRTVALVAPQKSALLCEESARFEAAREPFLRPKTAFPRLCGSAFPRARAVSSPPSAVPGGRANARGGSPAAPALSSSRRARRAPSTTTARAAPRRRGGHVESGCPGGTRCRRRRRA